MSKYDPGKHHRHTIRLQGYDYSQPGAYFVTLCTQNRECVLGEIVDNRINCSAAGQIAHDFWAQVAAHFSQVDIPSFVIMPNHVHAMIVIIDIPPATNGVVWKPRPCFGNPSGRGVVSTPGPGQGDPAPTVGKPDLGHIVAFYKYQTTKRINALRVNPGCRFWQRNYFEHIVRNDDEYRQIVEYIQTNPLRWESDQLHPAAAPNPFNQD